MRTLFRIWLAFSAMATTLPGAADGQDASAFDGMYAGASIVGRGTGKCTPAGRVPRPLRISGGKAHLIIGAHAEWEFAGPVTIDGTFILKDDAGTRMTGKIDAMGAVTASVADTTNGCTYVMTWRYE